MRRIGEMFLAAALTAGVMTAQSYGVVTTGVGAPSGGCDASRVGRKYIDTSNGRPYECKPDGSWQALAWQGEGGGSLPSGAVFAITSGTCPSGTTEATDLNGYTLFGTVAANSDVGTTGGNNDITPAGTIAWPGGVPTFSGSALGTHTHTFTGDALGTHTHTFTGDALGTHTHTFTGNALANHTHTYTDVLNHTHPVTDPGHTHGLDEGTTDGSGTFMDRSNAAAATTAVTNSATTGISVNNPSGGVATGTTAGTTGGTPSGTNASVSAGTPSGTNANVSGGTPSGTNASVSGGTPSGTVAWPAGVPALTGTQFDNRSAFKKVILCRAN